MKLCECDISIRLMNGFGGIGITTIEEVLEIYQEKGIDEFKRYRNFGSKSFKEIVELIEWTKSSEYKSGISFGQKCEAENRLYTLKLKTDKIKTVGKLINKVLFYDDEIDYTKLTELSKRLEKLLK